MSAISTTIEDPQQPTEQAAERERVAALRRRLIDFARTGTRIFVRNRLPQVATDACCVGFVVSVTHDHCNVDVSGRSVVLRLASVRELSESIRRGDLPSDVVDFVALVHGEAKKREGEPPA